MALLSKCLSMTLSAGTGKQWLLWQQQWCSVSLASMSLPTTLKLQVIGCFLTSKTVYLIALGKKSFCILLTYSLQILLHTQPALQDRAYSKLCNAESQASDLVAAANQLLQMFLPGYRRNQLQQSRRSEVGPITLTSMALQNCAVTNLLFC